MKSNKARSQAAPRAPEPQSLDPDDQDTYDDQAAALRSWERMLRYELERRKEEDRLK